MKFNENATVEQYIIRFLRDELGYTFIKPEAFSTLRQQENEVLIESHLKDALRKINGIDDVTVLSTIIREVRKADTNQSFLNLLRSGIELKNSETGKTSKYRLIDFVNQGNNDFVVTNQFYFAGDVENIRPDIMLFVMVFR